MTETVALSGAVLFFSKKAEISPTRWQTLLDKSRDG
jgi:hypothetical protein